MELLNATGMVAAYTQGLAPDGRESLVVIIKGTFTLPHDGSDARLAELQIPLVMADEFDGEPGLSAPLREMDFAPEKPACDVLVVGSAYAPAGRPVTELTVGIRIGRVSKAFNVTGPRVWQPGVIGVSAGDPQHFVRQPLSYAAAFGGTHPSPSDPEQQQCYARNPAGCGWFARSASSADILGTVMPATEELANPIQSPHGDYVPMALGPLGRNWLQRYPYAGTYDEAWLENGFPFLPADFDPRYFQAAPLDQQTDYLRGGEDVLLLGLTPQERAGFKIPTINMPVTFFLKKGGHQTVQAVIDTLVIDTDQQTVQISWRVNRPLKKNMFEISQVLVGTKSLGWWRARELGKAYFPSLTALEQTRRAAKESC